MKPTIKDCQSIKNQLENNIQHSNTIIMKKLLLLLLLFTGMVNAQAPIINTPQNLHICDFDNDGVEFYYIFDLAPTVLGSLNPNLYAVNFYRDSLYENQIASGVDSYLFSSIIYIKVTEIANQTNIAYTQMNVILDPTPVVGTALNLTQVDIPYDHFSTFDLTSQSATILNGLQDVAITYYPSVIDAQNSENEILNSSNYTNLENYQTICAKVTNTITGCYSLSKFKLMVTNPDILYIPDPVFRSKVLSGNSNNEFGMTMPNDANSDGEIQISEAEQITLLYLGNDDYLYPNNAIYDLTGLEAFTNLKLLTCGGNRVSSTTLNIGNLIHLEALYCDRVGYWGELTTLDVTNLVNLKILSCSQNNISYLNLAALTNLDYLNVGFNPFSMNLNQLTNLQGLDCSGTGISTLDVSGLVNLNTLRCTNNNLSSLSINNLTNLTTLACFTNTLTTLDVSALTNLTHFECYANQITTLDVSNLINLTYFDCAFNPITSLDVSGMSNLENFVCAGSQLSTLDISNCIHLDNVYCGQNNQLSTLFAKNGKNENIQFSECPNLQYICADDFQIASLQATSNPNVMISTYCTFVPGGNYNKVTGLVKYDYNNNGCDTNQYTIPNNVRLNISDGTISSSTFLNSTGIYNLYTGIGDYTLTTSLENPNYYNITPTTTNHNFTALDSSIATQNFCLTPNGVHPDVEVVLSPEEIARPGFDAKYKLIFKNKGNQTLSGNVNLTFDDNRTDFVSALPSVNLQATSSLTWNYSNLLPFETRIINLVLNINSPMETPAVNSGDILNFSSSVNPIAGDELPDDNTFELHQTVVNSLDPNDIVCLEGNQVATERIGEYLHYLVRFENTGTASAVNIVVKDIIDTTKFDINTLQVISASADERTVITGNVVEFIFENINLERNSGNPPVGGHGDVLFKIKTKDNLNTGDMVINNANIYFDYNFPILTNDAETTFATLRNSGFTKDESITVYPNPTTSRINIAANSDIKSIALYDVQGRVLETILGNTKFIDITDKANGVYFLKISTNKGSKVEKVMKE